MIYSQNPIEKEKDLQRTIKFKKLKVIFHNTQNYTIVFKPHPHQKKDPPTIFSLSLSQEGI